MDAGVYFMGLIISALFMLATGKAERFNNIYGDWQDVHYTVRQWYHVRRYREYVMTAICFIPVVNFIISCTCYISIIIVLHKKK